MKTGARKTLGCLVLAVLLFVSFVTPVFAGSPSPPWPSRPNLVWDVSSRKTAIVHLVNTTPFDMSLTTNPFVNKVYQQAPQDYDEGPIVYSPSGVPTKIPKQSGASFVISWLDTGSGASDVKAEAVMVYTMAVDTGDNYSDSLCGTNGKKGNVNLQIEFDRVKQTKNLKSEIFKTVLNATSVIVDGLTMIAEPEDALAWAGFITNSVELVTDCKEINENNEDWDQIYVNSFILASDGNVNKLPSIITDYGSDENTASQYDGVATQQSTTNGCPQAYIVVGSAILREKQASHKTLDGNVPVLLVALATSTDWEAAISASTEVSLSASKAGYQISQQVKREGKNGRKALFKLVRTMSPGDLAILKSAYSSIQAHKALSQEQEGVLAKLAAAFEKHAATMQTGSTTKTSTTQNSDHKSPGQNSPVHRAK